MAKYHVRITKPLAMKIYVAEKNSETKTTTITTTTTAAAKVYYAYKVNEDEDTHQFTITNSMFPVVLHLSTFHRQTKANQKYRK